MSEFVSRYGRSLTVAIGLHLCAAVIVGLASFHINKTPPNIMEVTLAGGGGGGSSVQVASNPSTSINTPVSKDDVLDKKLKNEDLKNKIKQDSNSAISSSTGEGTGNGTGTGSGTGSGSGSGTGSGVGSGNGSGVGDGSGSGLASPTVPPRLASKTNPRYPLSARSQGISGVTRVRMLVNASGRVESASVSSSSGNGDLDASAVECVYKWRFTPAKNSAGQSVPCYITIPVKFVLN